VAEGKAIPFPLFEHDRPTEPGLRRFEHEKRKVFSVIVDWHTPFVIVIQEHKQILHTDPGTSFGSRVDLGLSVDLGFEINGIAGLTYLAST
jgi:hypothetical protein